MTGVQTCALPIYTADSADDVSIRNLTVTWDKVVVKAEDAEALPAGVTIANSIAKGATSINVTIPATVSTRAAGDVTGAKITVKEGTKVLANKTDLTTGENEVALSPAVSGTAAITVKVELTVDQAPVAGQTVTVTAPDGWTATGSPYTVPSTGDKKVTVTLTSNTKGELSPAKTLTVTPASGWTAGAVSFTNGTGNASSGTAATFTFDVTVSAEGNVTIAKTAFAVADAGVTPSNVTTKVALGSTADSAYTITKVNDAAYNATTGVTVAANSTVTVVLTAKSAANLAADALKNGTVTADGATVTCTGNTEGKAAVAAVDAAIETTDAITDIDSLKAYTVAAGKELYYGDAGHTDATSLDGLTKVANPSEVATYPTLQSGTLTWYVYTTPVQAVAAKAATVTLTFTAVDGTVTINNIVAANG